MTDKNLFFTLRRNWKKSLFGFGVFTYGLNYGSKRYREYLIRRGFFLEAKKYGDEKCHPMDKPKQFYVILNPAADNSNCKKKFMKNAAPIFYLAGIDITFIQTYYSGHAKTLPNYFDPQSNGIIVAGGDGSLQEVLTGLLRQPQNSEIRKLPVGLIPLGESANSMYNKLFGEDSIQVRAICKSAMAIVRGDTKHVSVMEVLADTKPIYAFSNIHIGLYQQVKEKIDKGKYWLLGPLKKYFAFIWRTVRGWPSEVSLSMNTQHSETANPQSMSNLSFYLNEDNNEPVILVQKTPTDLERKDFIEYGWSWLKNKFQFTESELNNISTTSSFTIDPLQNESLSYEIDGEMFEARPISVSILPKQVEMFCEKTTL